jgi:hypothetical protein
MNRETTAISVDYADFKMKHFRACIVDRARDMARAWRE